MTLPYYSHIFIPKTEKQVQIIIIEKSNIQTAEFKIEGMTCTACQEHIKSEVDKVNGIISSDASYKKGNALVQFDSTKTTVQVIKKAINSTGFMVTEIQNK